MTVRQAPADPSLAAIALDGVTVSFASRREEITALDDLTVEFPESSFVSLLGPSGCGKSTLLRIVADLIQPTRGAVRVFGDTARRARTERELGFVFQQPALLPWRTTLDNVRLPLEVGGGASQFDPPEALLEMVGLAGRENAYPHELSGGMSQRVSIARALVTRPRLLLMDEPFGALDEITRNRLNAELLNIWRATGTTVLFVTHSISEAVFLSQTVVVLSARPGRVRGVVAVPLPYPREPAIRETPEFAAHAARMRALLEEGDE